MPAARWDSLSREAGIVKGAEQWQQRLDAAPRGSSREDGDGRPPDWVTRADRGRAAARAVHRRAATARLVERSWPGARGPRISTTCRELLAALRATGADDVVVALRGLERFTALEAEVDFDRFLDVVRRALETLRSEDVLDSTPGAFARAGCNIVAVNSLRRDRVSRACGSSARPSGRSRRRRARIRSCSTTSARRSPSGRRRRSRRAADARQRGGADLRARVRGGARAARRLLRAPRDRREPAAAAVGVLPRARLTARGRARVGRRGAAAARARTWSGSRATRSARRSGRARATTRRRSAPPRPRSVSEPERDRTYLQARVTRPLAVATFERAQPVVRARARGVRGRFARSLLGLGRCARTGCARRDRDAAARPTRRCRPTSLEGYATCPQRFMLERLLRVRAVEEPEQVVRIDALSRAA